MKANSPRQRQLLLLLVVLAAVGSTVLVVGGRLSAHEQPPEAWVSTWAAAPAAAPLPGPAVEPVSSGGFHDQTVRMMVHTSVGGGKARLRLSNRFGDRPLVIGHATLGLPLANAGPGDLRADSVHELTFMGQKSVTIPTGGTVFSDATAMDVPWNDNVAVSLYLPVDTGPPTVHYFSRTTSFIGSGDSAGSASGAKLPKTIRTWWFINGLDVLDRTGAGSIVLIGDSMGEAYGASPNSNHRWSNYLANRLAKAAPDRAPAVLNASLAGNRLGRDGSEFQAQQQFGPKALARFYQDVVGQTGVRAVIMELGINDVWMSHDDPDAIIAHMQELAALAHEIGLKIYACTLGPWEGAGYNGVVQYTPALDSNRLVVNSYLRTTRDFDGLFDFDLVLRDPAAPTKVRANWDSGDHIHPNDAGNEAMAASIPLDVLLKR
jgi:lysophospholipase L1-like esterase